MENVCIRPYRACLLHRETVLPLSLPLEQQVTIELKRLDVDLAHLRMIHRNLPPCNPSQAVDNPLLAQMGGHVINVIGQRKYDPIRDSSMLRVSNRTFSIRWSARDRGPTQEAPQPSQKPHRRPRRTIAVTQSMPCTAGGGRRGSAKDSSTEYF